MINIPVKKLKDNAVMPIRSHKPDAGFDLTCTSIKETEKYIQYGTGIAMHIPEGYVGLIFPRSSVTKKDLMLKNSVGIIDSGYLGEISFRFWRLNHSKQVFKIDINDLPDTLDFDEFMKLYNETPIQFKDSPKISKIYDEYEVGDRIGQMIIFKLPDVSFEEVDDLEDSERGTGGYGSTNK